MVYICLQFFFSPVRLSRSVSYIKPQKKNLLPLILVEIYACHAGVFSVLVLSLVSSITIVVLFMPMSWKLVSPPNRHDLPLVLIFMCFRSIFNSGSLNGRTTLSRKKKNHFYDVFQAWITQCNTPNTIISLNGSLIVSGTAVPWPQLDFQTFIIDTFPSHQESLARCLTHSWPLFCHFPLRSRSYVYIVSWS